MQNILGRWIRGAVFLFQRRRVSLHRIVPALVVQNGGCVQESGSSWNERAGRVGVMSGATMVDSDVVVIGRFGRGRR